MLPKRLNCSKSLMVIIVYQKHEFLSGIDDSKPAEKMWIVMNVQTDHLERLSKKTSKKYVISWKFPRNFQWDSWKWNLEYRNQQLIRILTEKLGLQKLNSKFVSHQLNNDQKLHRVKHWTKISLNTLEVTKTSWKLL